MKKCPAFPRDHALNSRAVLGKSIASLLAALSVIPHPSHAATIITPAGFTETFDVEPLPSEWSTATEAGAAGNILDTAAMDAFVASLQALFIDQPINAGASFPAAGPLAQFDPLALNIQTRPTGVNMVPIMATLENGTGGSVSQLDLEYDLGANAPLAEGPGLDGHRVYFSLDGFTWTNIEPISGIGTPGRLSTVVDLGSWDNGSQLFLLWADDNGPSSPDTGFTLDNVFFAPHTVIPPGDTIVWDRAHAVGGAPNGEWNTAGSNYWLNGANPDSFADNDIAVFSQDGDTNIDVTGNVAPNEMRVSNATGTYTIGGVGRISGPLVKSNGGTLVLTSDNDLTRVEFTGGTIVSQSADSLGAGPFTVDGAGGTLQTDVDTTIGGIRGEALLTKTGDATLILSPAGSGNGTGGILVQSGKIQASSGASFGGIGQVITLPGTSLEMITLTGETTYVGAIDVTTTGATISVLNAGAGLVLPSDDSLLGSGTITIAGDGALRVRSENLNLTSNFIINSGTLEYGDGRSSALGSGSITVNAGGRLAGRSPSLVQNHVILNGGDLGTRTGDDTEFAGAVDVMADSTVTMQSYSTPVNSQNIRISGVLGGAADLILNGNNPQPDPLVPKALILMNTDNTFMGTFRVSPAQVLSSEPIVGVGSTLNGRPVVLSNATLRIRDDGTDSGITIPYGNNITVDTGDFDPRC